MSEYPTVQYYQGRPVEELSRNELIAALKHVGAESEKYMKLYYECSKQVVNDSQRYYKAGEDAGIKAGVKMTQQFVKELLG
jgi:hypothetical protein